jgi:hypothetical protein
MHRPPPHGIAKPSQLFSYARLRGFSLLPLEPCLTSLNSTTTPLACQTTPVTVACNRSGRSRDATPPAPVSFVPRPVQYPKAAVKVPIGPRAAHRRAPAIGPPPASSSRRWGLDCFDFNLFRVQFVNRGHMCDFGFFFRGSPCKCTLGFLL